MTIRYADSPADDHSHHAGRLGHFHHFCDYNWDTRAGAPSFVTDPPSDEVIRDASRLEDVKTYVRNAARWLAR